MLPNINVFVYFAERESYENADEDDLNYLGVYLEEWNRAKIDSQNYEDIGTPFQKFEESQEYVIRDKDDGKYYQASRYFLSWDQSSPWVEADITEVVPEEKTITLYKRA